MSDIERIQVFVSHEDPVRQAGSLAMLRTYGDFEVREADIGALVRSVGGCSGVVITDHARGLQLATAAYHWQGPQVPKLLIVTASIRECDIRSALAKGVRGYLLAGCSVERLADAVRAVQRGERVLDHEVAARLAANLAQEPLTSREEQVLALVMQGLCNKSIASRLGIAVATVKTHLKATFGKLDVTTRTQAAAAAERRGIVRGNGFDPGRRTIAHLPLPPTSWAASHGRQL
jgi:DNA-binding NarL/FixJ family response regulator